MRTRDFANRLVLGLWLAASAVATTAAQGDTLERARQFVRAAYPELAGAGAQVMIPLSLDQTWISKDIRSLRLLVYRSEHSGGPPDLVVRYELDGDGRPKLVLVSGPHVGFERWAALQEEVNSNPDWTDGTIRSRLETSGAKYASVTAHELLKIVDLDRFRLLLGDFRVIEATFAFRTSADDVTHRRAILEWTVRTELPRGSKVPGYVFVFEPFEGKLLAIRQATAEER